LGTGKVKSKALPRPSISSTDGGVFRSLLRGGVPEIDLRAELVAGGLRNQRLLALASTAVDGREVDVVGSSLERRVPFFGLGIFCQGFVRNFEGG
jgi:hypothetical protein